MYENDFNAERSAREKQNGELQKLKEDHENLIAERDGLLKEFERAFNSDGIRNHQNPPRQPQGQNFSSAYQQQQRQQQQHQQYDHLSRQYQGRGQQPPQQPNREQEPVYQTVYDRRPNSEPRSQSDASQESVHRPCPKCNENFPDLDSLQIHMIDCMDDE